MLLDTSGIILFKIVINGKIHYSSEKEKKETSYC